jgi:hypothetical protein
MKWINRSNLKEVNEAFVDALKVQYGKEWDLAYLRQDTVFAISGGGNKYVGFPESMDEANMLKAMSHEELAAFILDNMPPDILDGFKED